MSNGAQFFLSEIFFLLTVAVGLLIGKRGKTGAANRFVESEKRGLTTSDA